MPGAFVNTLSLPGHKSHGYWTHTNALTVQGVTVSSWAGLDALPPEMVRVRVRAGVKADVVAGDVVGPIRTGIDAGQVVHDVVAPTLTLRTLVEAVGFWTVVKAKVLSGNEEGRDWTCQDALPAVPHVRRWAFGNTAVVELDGGAVDALIYVWSSAD